MRYFYKGDKTKIKEFIQYTNNKNVENVPPITKSVETSCRLLPSWGEEGINSILLVNKEVDDFKASKMYQPDKPQYIVDLKSVGEGEKPYHEMKGNVISFYG